MPRFDRLNQWANFLDDLPHDGFHMPNWCSPDHTRTSCGTAGCAAGWAVNRFHKEGLWIKKIGEWDVVIQFNAIEFPHTTIDAISTFFGISRENTSQITIAFNEYASMFGKIGMYSNRELMPEDITPQMAATMIRKIIKELGGEVIEDYPIKETKPCPSIV